MVCTVSHREKHSPSEASFTHSQKLTLFSNLTLSVLKAGLCLPVLDMASIILEAFSILY